MAAAAPCGTVGRLVSRNEYDAYRLCIVCIHTRHGRLLCLSEKQTALPCFSFVLELYEYINLFLLHWKNAMAPNAHIDAHNFMGQLLHNGVSSFKTIQRLSSSSG